MVSYPIRVPRHPYRGNDPRKRAKADAFNRDAADLEKITNEMIKEKGPGVYYYWPIADKAGLSEERVREVMFAVDCGSGGFTVLRGANGEILEGFEHLAAPRDD